MLKSDLDFDYPEELVATERKAHSRVMWVEKGEAQELSLEQVLDQVREGDLFVVNETRVIPARIFSEEGLEILFVRSLDDRHWEVLCPVRKWPKGADLKLPGGVTLKLIDRGRPARVQTSIEIAIPYFFEFGEMPLPPYIQQARGERHTRPTDRDEYQTQWANQEGSLAAPTASLHFTNKDLQKLEERGVSLKKLVLHVGLGTFLPISADDLNDHLMHAEFVQIPDDTWKAVKETRDRGGKVWALGSTVTRALESRAHDLLPSGVGETRLFIHPGFEFRAVDVLMTNFHQPQSTLVAMVMAFAGEEVVKRCYQWAINKKFRLFSYGDLSVWVK